MDDDDDVAVVAIDIPMLDALLFQERNDSTKLFDKSMT